tara:strand:+ start:6370 stop:7599 length:1230 start_codon:yes stop_codon:yes gene_type:complete
MLNTYDANGGAAIATTRLFQGLRSLGVAATLRVQQKSISDESILGPSSRAKKLIGQIRPSVDNWPASGRALKQKGMYSTSWLPDTVISQVKREKPDLVHLFWVTDGFVRIESLKKLGCPIVWTLHDMWPFTGGCHYDGECARYTDSCGMCPMLNSHSPRDLSSWVLRRKHNAWNDLPIHVVPTSEWIGGCARSSSILGNKEITVIPNGLDLSVYKPLNKSFARAAFNLPPDKKLVLVSAFDTFQDERKGGGHAVRALNLLWQDEKLKNIELVVLGDTQPPSNLEIGAPVHYLPRLYDEISQATLYSAIDVLLAPSRQENLSNTVMEALACGAPVVAFNVGGMPDMISHLENGYLAPAFNDRELAVGISWVLDNTERYGALSERASQVVAERYEITKIARRYRNLYEQVL